MSRLLEAKPAPTPELDERPEEESVAYVSLPADERPKVEPAARGQRGAALIASAVFAAGITSLLVFEGTHPATESASSASGPAPSPARTIRRVPASPLAWLGFGSDGAWVDPLVPFGFEPPVDRPAVQHSPGVAAAPAPAPPAAEAAPEPMIERSETKPRLRLMENLVGIARTSGPGDGFRLLSVDQTSFWSGVALGGRREKAQTGPGALLAGLAGAISSARATASAAAAAARRASPGASRPPAARLWRSLNPYAAARVAPRTELGTAYRAAATSMTNPGAPELITSGGPESRSDGYGAGVTVGGAVVATALPAAAQAAAPALAQVPAPGGAAPVSVAAAQAAAQQAFAPIPPAPPPPASAPVPNLGLTSGVGAATPAALVPGSGVNAGSGVNVTIPDMTNVNTNDDGWRSADCAATAGCTVSHNRSGEMVMTYSDGTSWTKLGYNQSAQFGYRNAWEITEPNGTQYEELNSPLVFDLKGRGVRVSDRLIRYDIDGDGRPDLIRDVATTSGVLVFDSDRDGVSGSSGRGLFGTSTDLGGDGRPDGFKDGFEAFRAFVLRAVRQGVLSPGVLKDRRLGAGALAKLEKAYGLKLKVGSLKARAIPLRAAGVTEISLGNGPTRLFRNFDGQGNAVLRAQGASFLRADGSTGAYEDVFFWTRHIRFQAVAGAVEPRPTLGIAPEGGDAVAAPKPLAGPMLIGR